MAMRSLAAIHPPDAVSAMLACLGLPGRVPPLEPARAGPEKDPANPGTEAAIGVHLDPEW
jgi:hypothetical protein